MGLDFLTSPAVTSHFVVACPKADPSPEKSILALPRDYGFDFDDDELARELLTPLPAPAAVSNIPEVEADEFEQVYQPLLS